MGEWDIEYLLEEERNPQEQNQSILPDLQSQPETIADAVIRGELEERLQQSIDVPAVDLLTYEETSTFNSRGAPILDNIPREIEWRRGGEARVRALTEMFGEDALVLGHLTFAVPPLAIRIKKGNITYRWKPLRTKESIAVKSGNGECYIEIDLMFVGLHQIQESLAHLISLWKKSPFCFIENLHIRRMMIPEHPEDSMAVCLETLVMDAVAGAPNQVMATLLLRWFNYKPFSQNFWYRRDWDSAIATPDTSTRTPPEAPTTEPVTESVETSSGGTAPTHPDDNAVGIVDLSTISSPEVLAAAYPPEVRIGNVNVSTNPGDNLIAPTYPVVYPFNSKPFMKRVVSGPDSPQRISSWTDGLTMKWRSFVRVQLPNSWAREAQDSAFRTAQIASPSRDRGAEQIASAVEGKRDIILIVGDSITVGYTGIPSPGSLSSPSLYTGSRFSVRDGFIAYTLARQGASTNSMKEALNSSLSMDEFKHEGEPDGSRLAGVIIMGGLNDGCSSADTISYIQEMANMTVAKGAIAVVLTPTPFKDSNIADETGKAEVCEGVMAIGAERGSDRIIALNTHEILGTDPTTFLSQMKEDLRIGSPPAINLHLRATGYSILARWISGRIPWGRMEGVTPENLWTVVNVEDGDTITVRKGDTERVIRFASHDTPEKGYPFHDTSLDSVFPDGQDTGRASDRRFATMATRRMEELCNIDGNDLVEVEFGALDATGTRWLAVVKKGNRDLGEDMILRGLAYANENFAVNGESAKYIQAQQYAEGRGNNPTGQPIGMWEKRASTLTGDILNESEEHQDDVRTLMHPRDWRVRYPHRDRFAGVDPIPNYDEEFGLPDL